MRNVAYDGVRILMVTSESQSEQVNQALKAGANEYLMKPFNKDVLVAKLNLLTCSSGRSGLD